MSDKLNNFFNLDSFVVFGAGDAKVPIIKYLQKIGKRVIYLSDNNSDLFEKLFDGIRTIEPKNIKSVLNSGTGVVIASSYQKEIYNQLLSMGISEKIVFPYMTEMFVSQYGVSAYDKTAPHLDSLLKIMSDSESATYLNNLVKFRRFLDPSMLVANPKQAGFYDYNETICKLNNNDVVLDCGAYTGDTASVFLSRALVSKIYAVEGMGRNFTKMKEWILKERIENVIPIKRFLGNGTGAAEIYFEDDFADPRSSCQDYGSSEKLSEKVSVSKIDELFFEKTNPVDLIKIDVEGADLSVLEGGMCTIKANMPKIMVAAYHTLDHLWAIPGFINKLSPEYKIYAGHHNKCIHEVEYYCGV